MCVHIYACMHIYIYIYIYAPSAHSTEGAQRAGSSRQRRAMAAASFSAAVGGPRGVCKLLFSARATHDARCFGQGYVLDRELNRYKVGLVEVRYVTKVLIITIVIIISNK